MITDFDPPLRKLAEEFVPHSKLLLSAVMSLWPVYFNRTLSVDKWRYVFECEACITLNQKVECN